MKQVWLDNIYFANTKQIPFYTGPSFELNNIECKLIDNRCCNILFPSYSNTIYILSLSKTELIIAKRYGTGAHTFYNRFDFNDNFEDIDLEIEK